MRLEALIKLINQQRWKYAKTYHQKAPHEYIMADWNIALYQAIKAKMDIDGYNKPYYTVNFRYVDIDGYKYWLHGNSTLNREPLAGYTDEQKTKFLKEGYTS